MLFYGTIFLVVAGLIGVLWVYSSKHEKKELEKMFGGRRSLSPAEFYAAYFEASDVSLDIVTRVIHVLEGELGLDMSRLSAEDNFSENLFYFPNNDSLFEIEFMAALEQEFGITFEIDDLHKLMEKFTVRNTILLVNATVSGTKY